MTKVLIVDDNEKDLYLLKTLLDGNSFVVTTATNGAEALESARRDPPDIIITDILMPVMDGLTMCRRWMADEKLKDIPLVFYTATYTDPRDEEFALSLGAARFIIKPAIPANFIVRLREVIAEREAGRLVAAPPAIEEEVVYLKEYNQLLIRKLEDKMLQMEEAYRSLKESEEKYRRMIETAMEGVWRVDAEGNTIFVNQRMADMLGYSVGEMVGAHLFSFMDEDERAVAAPKIERHRQGVALRYEIRFRRKDGSRLSAILSIKPVFDDDGQYAGALAMITDIGERVQAEESLRETEKKYRSIFENAVEGIFQTTPRGRFLTANPAMARIFGYDTAEELMAATTDIEEQHYLDAERRREFKQIMEREGFVQGFDIQLRRRDGSHIWVSESARAVRDESGNVLYYEGSIEDITGRKHLEEQLFQSQKMEAVGSLAGGIAHDFNNLLTVILGYSRLSLESLEEADPLYSNMEEIRKAAERASMLTIQLLAFSRRQVLQPRVLDLNAVITDIEKMLKRLIGEDVELITRLEPNLKPVKADLGQIGQVIVNLAANARAAMHEGGSLIVETANVELDEEYARRHVELQPGSYIRLSVSDTGTGMDAATRSRIFEPFFTTKEQGKGTGLGLSTVYGIVKQSGGHIWVYSEPGQGTTMKIYLPHAEESTEISAAEDHSVALPRGSETILLVEDEDAVRGLAQLLLEESGYQVLEAANGGEAMLICEQHQGPIHLIITDIVMPRMSGPELVRRLVSIRPDIKALFMSGYTDDTIVHRGILDEGVAFLQKPFTFESLTRKVRELLDSSK